MGMIHEVTPWRIGLDDQVIPRDFARNCILFLMSRSPSQISTVAKIILKVASESDWAKRPPPKVPTMIPTMRPGTMAVTTFPRRQWV